MSTQSDAPNTTAHGLAQAPTPAGAAGACAASGPRTVESHDLLAGQSSVLIRHLGEIYRLQTTRQGKLILTK